MFLTGFSVVFGDFNAQRAHISIVPVPVYNIPCH